MIKETRLQGVYSDDRKLFTKSLAKGQVYDEIFVKQDGEEFRSWNPRKSKLSAGIKNGLSQIGIKPSGIVLYLGAASGTTVSHVSDIVGVSGLVFAVEFAIRSVRDLIFLAESRPNIAPIYLDANKVDEMSKRVSYVDVVFQDIAQKNQADIFVKNCLAFLEKGGFGMLCVKARSVDVVKKPAVVYKEVRDRLEKDLVIVDFKKLDPFEKDHCIFVVKKK